MKNYLKILSFLMVGIFLLASTSAPAVAGFDKGPVTYTTGLDILVYDGNAFAASADTFQSNWERAGANVTQVLTYDFDAKLAGDNPDVLLLPRTEGINAANVSAIATWFDGGDKLLWVGGESDFGGFYNASETGNPLLAAVGTQLRLFSGSVEDPQSNDAAAYRVQVNTTGVASTMTNYVTAGFAMTVMHGPTAILYEEFATGLYKDLRNATLGGTDLVNVDIILNTSSAGIALDSDLSVKANGSDFYAYSNISGNYPMLAADQIATSGADSMAVVSGESIFTDYKFMNSDTSEVRGDWINGSVIIANVITYFFSEMGVNPTVDIYEDFETEVVTETETETETLAAVTETETETLAAVTETETETADAVTVATTVTETTPVDPLMILLGITSVGVIGIISRRRN